MPLTPASFIPLLDKIEAAVDARVDMTRVRPGRHPIIEEARIEIMRDTVTVEIKVRARAKRLMTAIHGDGASAEAATEHLLERLDIWAEAIK
jgi:hypothetical protein